MILLVRNITFMIFVKQSLMKIKYNNNDGFTLFEQHYNHYHVYNENEIKWNYYNLNKNKFHVDHTVKFIISS